MVRFRMEVTSRSRNTEHQYQENLVARGTFDEKVLVYIFE